VSETPHDDVGADARRLHDLRQPLAAILAAATALRLHTELDQAEREAFLKIIVQSSERLSEMLEELALPS
jgi:signal transduction histidine kinase